MTIIDIKKTLIEANNAYREGKPFMHDAQFDALEEKLRILDPNNEWFTKGVNDATPKKRKLHLPYPMMSLDKVKTLDALKSWMQKFPNAKFVITPKYDGLSVGREGDMSWTRGDGRIGQDCTKQLMHVQTSYDAKSRTMIRGEIIFDNANWAKFKERHPEATSSRNSATGLINGDFDANRIEDYNFLRVMPYELLGSQEPKAMQLKLLGSDVFEFITDTTQVTEEYLLELFLKWKKEYPIDGLVIDVNETKYRTGTEANGNPSYSIAYKSPSFSEMGTGIIKDIERSVNRNGIVTPVIVLEEPIFLSGAWINRISAINMRYVFDWALYPGEQITVIRSGEVIPKIIAVGNTSIPFKEMFNKTKDYDFAYAEAIKKRKEEITVLNNEFITSLSFCPSCGKFLDTDTPDDDWHELVCPGFSCRAVELDGVVKFFTIAQIDGFGEKKIEQIYDYITSKPGNDSNFCTFFSVLNIKREELLSLEGWAETSVDNFLNEINKIKTTLPFARFLHATGWFGELGEKTLQKILDADGWSASLDILTQIEGVQEKTAKVFLNGIRIYDGFNDFNAFSNAFKFAYIKTSDMVKEGKLSGVNVCMTGFRDKFLVSQISDLGGNVLDSVTKNVNCVITKDKNSTSSKITKAKKMGIEILNIEEFKDIYLSKI
jgi:DNA ligase (NAD+)